MITDFSFSRMSSVTTHWGEQDDGQKWYADLMSEMKSSVLSTDLASHDDLKADLLLLRLHITHCCCVKRDDRVFESEQQHHGSQHGLIHRSLSAPSACQQSYISTFLWVCGNDCLLFGNKKPSDGSTTAGWYEPGLESRRKGGWGFLSIVVTHQQA